MENAQRFFAEFPYPTYEEWRVESEKALKGANWEKKLVTKTYEGINLQPMYRQEDIADIAHCDSLPGNFPFLRGIYAGGYITNPWKICQACSDSLPEKMNQVLLHELEKGSNAVHIVLDQNTLNGKDFAESEAATSGRGLSLTTLEDVAATFHNISLETTPLFIKTGCSALQIISLLAAYMKANGKVAASLQGCIGDDLLGKVVISGVISSDLTKYYGNQSSLIHWVTENKLNLRTILVQSEPYHNGGASAIQELAFVLATGVEYIRNLQEQGLTIDIIAKQIQFSFSLGTNFFMEIAKLRAARMLWAQIIEAFGGNTEAQKMHIHARTSSFTKSTYDPYVNLLRATTEAFSGIVGGIDSLHVGYFDEAIRPEDDFSHRIARNTQIILQQECNLLQPIDPAGGSWYVENLTQEIAEKAWQLFQKVEEQGGMLASLEKGFPQEEVSAVRKKRFDGLAKRKDVILGTNMYPNLIEKPLEKRQFNQSDFTRTRLAAIDTYRKDIDEQESAEKLTNLTRAIAKESIVDDAIDAFFCGSTLGEVTAALYPDSQEARRIKAITPSRADQEYSELRQRAERFKEKTGKKLPVFLVNMGKIPQHKARADFAGGFLEVGAFDILKNNGFATVEEAVAATIDSGADVAVICSTDATYPELVPPLAEQIKARRPDITLFVAGLPPEDLQQTYKDAGVDDFIHVRANCYQILQKLQEKWGIQTC